MFHPQLTVATGLRRSTAIAFWWTLHALVAAVLMQYAMGEFTGKALGVGQFVPAEMTQVMQLFNVPLDPLPAFVVLFLGLVGSTYVLALLKRDVLGAQSAANADLVAVESLRWTVKQLLRPGWLVSTLVYGGLMAWALNDIRSPMGILIPFWLLIYILPLLVLRPRWLGSASADHSWRPSVAAVGVYGLLYAVDVMSGAGLMAMAGGLGKVTSALLSLCFVWLTASALVFVRDWQDVHPQLASRFNRRFLALMVAGTVHPVAVIVLWAMPPLLLLGHYHLLIAPAVLEMKQYAPAPLATFQQVFMAIDKVFPDLFSWWIAAIPLVTIAINLYIGRCLVAFEDRSRQSLYDDEDTFNTRAQSQTT